jgi:hypothetical protein
LISRGSGGIQATEVEYDEKERTNQFSQLNEGVFGRATLGRYAFVVVLKNNGLVPTNFKARSHLASRVDRFGIRQQAADEFASTNTAVHPRFVIFICVSA